MLIRMGMGTQLSGSTGGVVASRNRYGAYLRARSVPVNPNTARQLAVRAAFASASLGWAGLSSLQRGGWQSYATATPVLNRLGESVTLSANCMYVRTNAFLLGIGQPGIADAPSTPGLSSLGTAVSLSAVGPAVTFHGTDVSAGGPVIVSYSPIVGPGVLSFQGPFSRFASGPVLADLGVFAQNTFRYGLVATGERRFFRIAGSDVEGKLSQEFIQAVTVG